MIRDVLDADFAMFFRKQSEIINKIKNAEFALDINWELEIAAMSFFDLRTPLQPDVILNLKSDGEIIHLNLEKLLTYIYKNHIEQDFPVKQDEFLALIGTTMVDLIELIESNRKIIPPIIALSDDNTTFGILDGNHRIHLSRYLKLETIPFLIQRENGIELKKRLEI
jgi:hypothetical protein